MTIWNIITTNTVKTAAAGISMNMSITIMTLVRTAAADTITNLSTIIMTMMKTAAADIIMNTSTITMSMVPFISSTATPMRVHLWAQER